MTDKETQFIKGWKEYQAEKKQAIEEMAKVTCTNVAKHCIDCKDCSEYSDCILVAHAINLYNDNYRKLPKDSVVLSKEETRLLKEQAEQLRREIITLSQELVNSRKETAEKFAKDAIKIMRERDTYLDEEEIIELAKQFGVEVEE